ncbi:hypothetical protein CEV32_1784 [Brucella rhizosphaerae]|uniref:Uncharacterized protein n=1 Tax=Brucella rhizosphaerae TaxID=571254 RepID=A0A256F3C9_9HYPH|nr:hypothetical protein CEV32_1784 [Brucella rhizosphaerae]
MRQLIPHFYHMPGIEYQKNCILAEPSAQLARFLFLSV